MPVLPPAVNPEPTATRRTPFCTDAEDARPRRCNVRVSSEPQSVAARLRRERVSERMSALQRLVPGGARLNTAAMLEEAIRHVVSLQSHVQTLEQAAAVAAAAMHDVAGASDFQTYPYYA